MITILKFFFTCFVDMQVKSQIFLTKSYNTCVIIKKYVVSNYIIFMRSAFSILSHFLLVFCKSLKFKFFVPLKSYKNRILLLPSNAGETPVVLQ